MLPYTDFLERYEGLVKLSLCLASGVAAGTSASILTQPADVVKTYMQTERKLYTG